MVWHEVTVGICQLQALSPVGRCQSFDAAADGYGRGEGFAAVVLTQHGIAGRTAKAAAAAGGASPILAHLRGSAVNQDGRSSSLTAPNGPSQQVLVGAALAAGELLPAAVGLVAVHGTGTPLGDPIEVGALAAALAGSSPAAARDGDNSSGRVVSLASVKSCYGHTEGTAGLTGLLLAAAAAQQAALPPVVNLRSVNAYVASALRGFGAGSGAYVPRQPAPEAAAATASSAPVAGSSSFGMSGVNAHALLSPAEGAPAPAAAAPLSWHLQRYWPVPQQHRLVQLPRVVGADVVRFAAAVSSTAGLAYLWDHRVVGRPLMAGGVMLEMAAAAAASLAEAAGPATLTAVTGAALVAPCLLPPAGSARGVALEAAVSMRTGVLEVQSISAGGGATTCVTAHSGVIVAVKQRVPAATGSVCAASVASACVRAAGAAMPTAVSCARIQAPPADATAAYFQHPTATDASLHLSPITGQLTLRRVGPPAARIPVATGICTAPAKINAAGSSGGWASVKVGVCLPVPARLQRHRGSPACAPRA